jgi:hypothetical protein
MSDPSGIRVRDTLPEVNDLVRVSIAGYGPIADGDAADGVPTRVENVLKDGSAQGGSRYVIAAPRYQGNLELPTAGTVCTLEWPGAHGVWILPVSFVNEELAREEGLRVWVLDALGPPRQNERRNYVRVEWSVPINLTLMTAADIRVAASSHSGEATMAACCGKVPALPEGIIGETRNISEGGIRALLPLPRLPVGLGVIAKVTLSGQTFTLPSRVSWVRPTGQTGVFKFDLALAFDNPAKQGDTLRPLLFAEQLRIRRAGLS